MIAYLCEDLQNKGRPEFAKAIAISHSVQQLIRPEIWELLKDIEITEVDYDLDGYQEFPYSPLSLPKANYF